MYLSLIWSLIYRTAITILTFLSFCRLPMSALMTLLKDFLYIVNPSYSDVKKHQDLDLSEVEPHARFAVFLYHRWVLRANLSLPLYGKTRPAIEAPLEEVSDLEAVISAAILRKMCALNLSLLSPSLSCFSVPSSFAESNHSWGDGETLDGKRVTSEILLDLSLYLVR